MGLLRRRTEAEREEIRKRGSSRFKALIGVLIAVVFLVAAVGFFFWKPDVVFDVDAGAVASSLDDELPEGKNFDCSFEGEGRWKCARGEVSDSGPGLIVKLDDERCWRTLPAGGGPKAEGCLNLADYLFEGTTDVID
jgi:hypothetical protein